MTGSTAPFVPNFFPSLSLFRLLQVFFFLFVSAEVLEELLRLKELRRIVCVGRSVFLHAHRHQCLRAFRIVKIAEILNWERKKSVA